jgi:serine-protein kinase ATM
VKRIRDMQARTQSSTKKLLEEFERLKQGVHPVMRYYFTEKHKDPICWFAMRLNYTRSVASTSIVGHILGLGDRHTSNILIDNISGDVVHIDLGIAFDQVGSLFSLKPLHFLTSQPQGKLLPVPELVPFRMTRDIVDGMGMSGTSGVFHRCAEEILRVMRDGSEVLMTVLEVFKYDPLYNW